MVSEQTDSQRFASLADNAGATRALSMGVGRRLFLTASLSALAAGCAGSSLETLGLTEPEKPATPGSGDTIGTGSIKIGMIIPLSAANGQLAAQSLRNAAELALSEFSGSNPAQALQILVRDDRGTAEGARMAAQELVSAGAELVLGPLFAPNVQAAASVLRGAGRPMIAFSSDASVAQRGVYLLSFMPQSDVARIVEFAGSRGKRSFAGLVPQTAYGNVVQAELMNVGNQQGRRVGFVEGFQPGNPASLSAAVAKLKAASGQYDTLFIGEGADGIGAVLQALAAAGITGKTTQFVSTAIWSEAKVFAIPQLDGAWFAGPDATRFNQFAGRYQARFGSAPTRIATLSYDAVTLASALSQSFGAQRFTDQTLTNPNGFAGQDGVFRFRPTGSNDRGLAVFEIRSGSARAISPAPQSFAAGQ